MIRRMRDRWSAGRTRDGWSAGRTRDGWSAGRTHDGWSAGRTRDVRPGRGQTSVDFAIAIGLFIVALTVVITFLPSMIDPFAGTASENPLIADRTANQLTDYQLAGSAAGTLDTTCTLYFFNETTPSCSSWSDDDETINDRLGIGEDVQVNVTVEQNVSEGETDVLCGDKDAGRFNQTECDPGEGDHYRLAAGETPPDRASVAVARRMVFLEGYGDATMYVRVWS